jgi:hypothetical protein
MLDSNHGAVKEIQDGVQDGRQNIKNTIFLK